MTIATTTPFPEPAIAQGRLPANEARLRAIIEAEPECVKIVSPEGTLLEMNASGLAMLEARSLKEVLDKPLIDFVAPEFRAAFAQHFRDTIEGKNPGPFQFECLGLKGGRRWLETTAVPLTDTDSTVTSVLGITRDITERKHWEQAMRESSALQQLLIRMATNFVNVPIENIDDAINEALAATGRFVRADRAYLFRYDFVAGTMSNTHEWCEEGISAEIANSQNIPNASLPQVVGAHQRGEVFVLPCVSRLPEGDSFRVILEAQKIQSLILFPMIYDKQLLGFVGFDAVRATRSYSETEQSLLRVLADILANAEVRRTAEEALRKSKENFRALVETTSDFIWEVDVDGAYTYASPQIKKMLGYAPEEVLGKTPFDLMPRDEAMRIREEFRSIMQERRSFEGMQNLNVHRDGRIVVFETSGTPVFDEGGRFRGYRGIDRDVTARAQAEQALSENEERLRLALAAANQGLYDLNVQTGEVVVSPEYALMLGYTPEELQESNQKWRERLHPDDREEALRVYEEYVAGKRGDYRVEFRQKTKSGEWLWILSIGKIVEWDRDGRPLRMLGTHTEITERKQAMEELAANEQRYRTLFDLSPSGLMLLDGTGKILEVNDAFNRSHQYSRSELLGNNIRMLVPPDRHHLVDEHLTRIDTGETLEHEVVNLRKDGSTCVVELRETSITLPNGEQGVLSVANDVTERRRTEDALREGEHRFRTVVQNAQAVIFILDSAGIFRLSEGQALAHLGLRPGEVVGLSALEIYKDYPRVIEGITRALTGEVTRVMAQVQGLIFDTLYSPYFDRTGALAGVVGVATDITERIRSEQKLRESEELYHRFFEEDLTGVFISDPGGTFIDCNPVFLRIFGFTSKEEALGTNAIYLYESENQRREMIARILKEKKLQNIEMVLRRVDGEKIHVVENVIGTFNDQGELIQLMGYVSDITVQKQLEQQLVQSQKMESLGTLASGIAHDFNNILGIILGHASLLEGSRDTNAASRHHSAAIVKATDRGVGVVNQLLTFARKTDVVLESVRLNDSIEELTKLLKETFPKSITIETLQAGKLPSIIADANQMHQVLLNLCVNARDAMPAGGRLTITTKAVGGEEARCRWPNASDAEYVLLSVADTGSGMDEETRARVFEPFFTTKERGKGTGLGLATVYGIVQTHRGFIDVESEPGRGTAFVLCFPAQPRVAVVPVAEGARPADLPGGTETILFIEDEPMLTEMVVTLLAAKGYTLLTAADGAEGLELYRQNHEKIDLVVSDLGLPRLGGDELFLAVKSHAPDVRFILSSGFIDPGVKSRLTECGLQHILNKPYHPADVLRKIREVLDTP